MRQVSKFSTAISVHETFSALVVENQDPAERRTLTARRTLYRRAMALLTGLLVATSFYSPAPSHAQNEQRQVIRVSPGNEDIVTMDPHRATSSNDKGVVSQIYSALVRFAPGSADPKTFEPDLAESWEASSDAKVWTFRLRRGVKFHGEWGELTAADVVYSLQRSGDPARSSFASNFSLIDNVVAVDPYTVRVTLKYPDATFLGRVSNYHGGFIVSMKAAEKHGTKFGTNPVGTGPFAFSEHVTQQFVKLVAHDGYFRGKPKLAGITYRMIPSLSARELAFASGEIDLAYGKGEQRWVDRISKRKGTTVDIFGPGEYFTVHINQAMKPLDDIRVRKAIAHSINVDEIQAYAGEGNLSTKGCSAVPPGSLGVDCSAGTYPYNVEEAKKLLAAAGFPNGLTVKVIISSSPGLRAVMEIVQSQLAKTGIKLDMLVVDHPTYQAQNRKALGGLVLYAAARFPTADAWFTDFYDSAATVNTPTALSNFSHCSVGDSDIRAARSEPDAKKQLAFWRSAQQKIKENVCAVPLFDKSQIWVRSDRVAYGYTLKGAMNLAPPITEKTTLTSAN